jgi:hypothetical protein
MCEGGWRRPYSSDNQSAGCGRRSSQTVALANKLARMAWAIMAKGERYKEPVALAA